MVVDHCIGTEGKAVYFAFEVLAAEWKLAFILGKIKQGRINDSGIVIFTLASVGLRLGAGFGKTVLPELDGL